MSASNAKRKSSARKKADTASKKKAAPASKKKKTTTVGASKKRARSQSKKAVETDFDDWPVPQFFCDATEVYYPEWYPWNGSCEQGFLIEKKHYWKHAEERMEYFSHNSGLPLVYLAIMCKDPSFMESVLASDPPAPRGVYVKLQDVTEDDYPQSRTVYTGGKFSPLGFAIEIGNPDAARLLLEYGVDTREECYIDEDAEWYSGYSDEDDDRRCGLPLDFARQRCEAMRDELDEYFPKGWTYSTLPSLVATACDADKSIFRRFLLCHIPEEESWEGAVSRLIRTCLAPHRVLSELTARFQSAALQLLLIRRFRKGTPLDVFPIEIIRIICRLVWDRRFDTFVSRGE